MRQRTISRTILTHHIKALVFSTVTRETTERDFKISGPLNLPEEKLVAKLNKMYKNPEEKVVAILSCTPRKQLYAMPENDFINVATPVTTEDDI